MMKAQNSLLIIRQLDDKIGTEGALQQFVLPQDGWINLIRKTLNMSLRQLGARMSITPQSLRKIEIREKEGAITLKTLRDAAKALDMELVYTFIPKDGSLENMLERKAREMAVKIVTRTSTTMKLEDQENSQKRIGQAIEDMTAELKREMPKTLWD
ncbi:mobile mystery protein A [Chitinophaga sp. SYP-B3965]|uniref:mobile mystery protein A n=1 Tax=Chitinophaga sp. SYP-B3965 TaxID=2663120 RepID=UPI0020A6B9CB|nr:mobile mystery protein A [Chitinophaga sp. SYP-B3965]